MQLTINNIRLYEILRNKIGQQESENFIQMLDNKLDEMANSTSFEITTKEDAVRLETKISDFKIDMIKRLELPVFEL